MSDKNETEEQDKGGEPSLAEVYRAAQKGAPEEPEKPAPQAPADPDEDEDDNDPPPAAGNADERPEKPEAGRAKEPEEFRALRKREERLRRQTERQFAATKESLDKRARELEARERELERYRRLAEAKTMRERAELAGIDLEKLADEFGERTPTDDAREIAAAEVRRLEAEREAKARAEQKKLEEQQAAQRQAVFEKYYEEAAERPEIVELIAAEEWTSDHVLQLGLNIGRKLMAELKREPTHAEILDKVQERAQRLLGRTNNVQDANGQRENPAPQQDRGKPGNRAARTLTGKQGASPSAEADFDPNDRESVSAYLRKASRAR